MNNVPPYNYYKPKNNTEPGLLGNINTLMVLGLGVAVLYCWVNDIFKNTSQSNFKGNIPPKQAGYVSF